MADDKEQEKGAVKQLKYLVNEALQHDGKSYKAGQSINASALTDEQAAVLIEIGVISALDKPVKG